jgi:hypothetical protein
MTFMSMILKKLNEDKNHQAYKMSVALERVCLSKEASSFLVQSYWVLKVEMVALKTKMDMTKAEARASKGECARLSVLRYFSNEFLTMFGGSQTLDIFRACLVLWLLLWLWFVKSSFIKSTFCEVDF